MAVDKSPSKSCSILSFIEHPKKEITQPNMLPCSPSCLLLMFSIGRHSLSWKVGRAIVEAAHGIPAAWQHVDLAGSSPTSEDATFPGEGEEHHRCLLLLLILSNVNNQHRSQLSSQKRSKRDRPLMPWFRSESDGILEKNLVETKQGWNKAGPSNMAACLACTR